MADAKTGLFQKLMKNPQVMKMAEQMFNSMGQQGQNKFLVGQQGPLGDLLQNGAVDEMGNVTNIAGAPGNFAEALSQQGGVNASQLGSLALGAAKAHPFKTAGLIGMGAGNIGGLMDNDKFGGQLGGLALGGLGAATLASGNPYLQAVMTMGGGNLGALFDKLRARKELEEQQGIPNAGNPFAMMQR